MEAVGPTSFLPRRQDCLCMRILLTGFQTWGDVPANPTEELVRSLESPEVEALILPVSYGRAGEVVRAAIRRGRPDAVISLGLAPRSASIRVEAVALNVAHSETPDVDGSSPWDEPIDPEGPLAYRTTLPVREIVEALRDEGIPARLSHHAGTFLCNYVAYVALRELDRLGLEVPAGFIHVPYSSEIASKIPREVPSLPMRTLRRAVEIAIELTRSAATRGDSSRGPP